jgi:hypothetical protein
MTSQSLPLNYLELQVWATMPSLKNIFERIKYTRLQSNPFPYSYQISLQLFRFLSYSVWWTWRCAVQAPSGYSSQLLEYCPQTGLHCLNLQGLPRLQGSPCYWETYVQWLMGGGIKARYSWPHNRQAWWTVLAQLHKGLELNFFLDLGLLSAPTSSGIGCMF